MKLSIGIVGLPNVGKSTLFNTLTKQEVLAANYPFATIAPNVGIVPVPDERLEKLAEMSRSGKKIPAVVEFYDIAGLVEGAHKGEGLGNQFLAHIRETQAIVVVLRVFKNPEVTHVAGAPDALRDLEIILSELIFKDLETIEKRFRTLESEARGGAKEAKIGLEVLAKVREALEAGGIAFLWRESRVVHELQLLTAKRMIFLLNGNEEDVSQELKRRIAELEAEYIVMDLADEKEVGGLIKNAYKILDLISFFTTGEKETRAWTVRQGAKAPEAAGVIHTDFEKNFIRAEVISAEELFSAGSWASAKTKGKIRLEGKEYVVKDGDVVLIRHG